LILARDIVADAAPSCTIDLTLAFQNRETAALHEAWRRLGGNRGTPYRRDFDPRDHVALLPHMFVIEATDDPEPRFRYRLVGTNIVETIGRDATGTWVDDLYKDAPEVVEGFRALLQKGRPVRTFGKLTWVGKDFLSYESGIFPLLTDDGRIGRFVGLTIYSPSKSSAD
jgi:hypothetical protein